VYLAIARLRQSRAFKNQSLRISGHEPARAYDGIKGTGRGRRNRLNARPHLVPVGVTRPTRHAAGERSSYGHGCERHGRAI